MIDSTGGEGKRTRGHVSEYEQQTFETREFSRKFVFYFTLFLFIISFLLVCECECVPSYGSVQQYVLVSADRQITRSTVRLSSVYL